VKKEVGGVKPLRNFYSESFSLDMEALQSKQKSFRYNDISSSDIYAKSAQFIRTIFNISVIPFFTVPKTHCVEFKAKRLWSRGEMGRKFWFTKM